MEYSWLFWLTMTLFWTAVMSFYSTQEMACISLNKLRLDYNIAKRKKWAIYLSRIIENPTTLFSTTLIGVNIALMLSSECSRRLYEALGVNPNYAPIVEIPFVLLFGELVPMFAARIYSEHAARLGAPLLHASTTLLAPLVKIINVCFRHLHKLTREHSHNSIEPLLNREELQELLEDRVPSLEDQSQETYLSNIFSLKAKKASHIMRPLSDAELFSAQATVADVQIRLKKRTFEIALLFHKSNKKIIGCLSLIDILQAPETKRIREYSQAPNFVLESTGAMHIFLELYEDPQSCAIVLNAQGEALGIITFDDIMDELFDIPHKPNEEKGNTTLYFERTLPADTKISDFNEAFGFSINVQGSNTFAELLETILGRKPVVGDVVNIDSLELSIIKASVFSAKTIRIRSNTNQLID